MGKKTEGAVINTQGEVLLQHLDLGEGMALHLQLQAAHGQLRVFSSTGLLSVKRWRIDIMAPGFALVPGQQQAPLTAPEAEEYCQTRASKHQTNVRCVLPGMLPDGVSLQVEILAPLSTAVAALPDQVLTACTSPSQEPHTEQIHCDSDDGSVQLNAATLIQGMHALPGQLMLGMVAGFTVRQLFWCVQNWSAGRGFVAKEPPLSEAKVKAMLGALHVRMEQLLEDLDTLFTKHGAKTIQDDTGLLDRIEHLAQRLDQLTVQEQLHGSELRPLEAGLDHVDYQLRHLRLSPLSEEVAARSSTPRSTATSSPTALFREASAVLPSATAADALAPAQPVPALRT